MNFDEFLKIMKELENKMVQNNPADEQPDNELPLEASLEERTKYGSLLPRTGVHFLPDSKVVDFLKYSINSITPYFIDSSMTTVKNAAKK